MTGRGGAGGGHETASPALPVTAPLHARAELSSSSELSAQHQ